MKKHNYQYIVIGSGSAGIAGALLAKQLGCKTAIIEADAWGGSATNFRDIPFGVALNTAHTYRQILSADQMGFSTKTARYNFSALQEYQFTATKQAAKAKKILDKVDIDCYSGYARFVDKNTISVGNKTLTSDKFLIATGAAMTTSGIENIENIDCYTPDNILQIKRLPRTLAVIGSGSTGCEIAEYFATLGTQVILLEAEDRILPKEDSEASNVISKHLRNELGVRIITKARVVLAEEQRAIKTITFSHSNAEHSIKTEAVVLATTPEACTDLDLKNVGIQYSYRGIKVTPTLQTSCKNIYAAGDVIGGESSTEKATYQGKLATLNALTRSSEDVDYSGFVRLTDTFPQVAKIGYNDQDCTKRRIKAKTAVVLLDSVNAAITTNFRLGFVKLVSDSRNNLLGATIVAPNADLLAQELVLPIRMSMKVSDLAAIPHVTSSFSEAIRLAARELAERK